MSKEDFLLGMVEFSRKTIRRFKTVSIAQEEDADILSLVLPRLIKSLDKLYEQENDWRPLVATFCIHAVADYRRQNGKHRDRYCGVTLDNLTSDDPTSFIDFTTGKRVAVSKSILADNTSMKELDDILTIEDVRKYFEHCPEVLERFIAGDNYNDIPGISRAGAWKRFVRLSKVKQIREILGQ